MVISKKTIIFQGLRGGPTFSGGGSNFFQGGGGPYAHFYSYLYNFLLRNCIKMKKRTPTVFIVELADLIYKLP